ncbi:MAG: DNA replication and repair protein RecF [Cyclobacteriaceae bacterium]|nr:DNA replication and repair protein RecF [Cyclobacteriaceae bacterium]
MRLSKLHLLNFKNYREADVEFHGLIHCFLGSNGSGKTNLLEAIHYLSLTRGASGNTDTENIRLGSDLFLVRGVFEHGEKNREVSCSFGEERKKKMSEAGKDYSRFSEHIGKYPLVMVAPADIELVWDGGEVRRKFVDTVLSQLDKQYMEKLMTYQSHLRQRNGLLKMFADRRAIDHELLATYDERMADAADYIYKKRGDFTARLTPMLQQHYGFLVMQSEEVPGISYESTLTGIDFRKELLKRLDRDILLGRTTVGIHRDDFKFSLSDHDLKSFGSQGQQKSFLIALKLAEFDCLSEKNGFKPMLLLDDIFDKLDDKRIVQLMKLVTGGMFGQIFMTDARPGRSLDALAAGGIVAQRFLVEGGNLSEMT